MMTVGFAFIWDGTRSSSYVRLKQTGLPLQIWYRNMPGRKNIDTPTTACLKTFTVIVRSESNRSMNSMRSILTAHEGHTAVLTDDRNTQWCTICVKTHVFLTVSPLWSIYADHTGQNATTTTVKTRNTATLLPKVPCTPLSLLAQNILKQTLTCFPPPHTS